MKRSFQDVLDLSRQKRVKHADRVVHGLDQQSGQRSQLRGIYA